MSATNAELFCSDIFPFDVGPRKKRFWVHKAAVSRFSEPLEAMMTGRFKESCERVASLEDVDESTFTQFLEFVYSGNYNACPPEEDDHNSDGTEETDGEDERPRAIVQPPYLQPLSRRHRRQTQLECPSPPLPEPYGKFLAPIEFDVPKVVPFPTEPASIDNQECRFWNYSATLLSHVHLFNFADCYLVEGLRELATHNLYTALNTFTLYKQRVQDVVELVRHVYDTCPEPREAEQSIPSLREVVTHFATNNIEVLRTSKEFKDLVADGGPFAADLVVSMTERL